MSSWDLLPASTKEAVMSNILSFPEFAAEAGENLPLDDAGAGATDKVVAQSDEQSVDGEQTVNSEPPVESEQPVEDGQPDTAAVVIDGEIVADEDCSNTAVDLTIDPDTRHLAVVQAACRAAIALTNRTLKAFYKAITMVFLWWRLTDEFTKARLVKTYLGENWSEKRALLQVVRLCLELKNVKGTAPEVVAENKRRNDFVSRVAKVVEELDAHFLNERLRDADAEAIQDYLARRDKGRGKTIEIAAANILCPPRTRASNDPDPADPADAGDDHNANGNDTTGTDGDSDGDKNAEAGGDDSVTDNGEDEGRASLPRMSKAESMLTAAAKICLENALGLGFDQSRLMAACFRMDPDGSMVPVATLPCDPALALRFYQSLQSGGPSVGLRLLVEVATVMKVLSTPSKPAANSKRKQAWESACPAALFAINAEGNVDVVYASATETAASVLISFVPHDDLRFGEPGEYILSGGWEGATQAALSTALERNDVLLRQAKAGDGGFTAAIVVPRKDDIALQFRPYGAPDNAQRVFGVVDDETMAPDTEVFLNQERVRNLREFHAVPFLRQDVNKQRGVAISLTVADSVLTITHEEKRKSETLEVETMTNGGGKANILAVDFFTAIDALVQIGMPNGLYLNILDTCYLSILAPSALGDFFVTIPALDEENPLMRTEVFAEALAPENQG